MNYEKELAAKNRTRGLAEEKDKKAATILWRYILFYLSVIYFLSLYSYALDLLFYKLDYGDTYVYPYNGAQYVLYYVIIGYMIFPLSLLYNYGINHLFSKRNYARILIALFVAIALGFVIGDKAGYYIGEYRLLKNLLAFTLTAVSVELLRIWVVKLRIKDKQAKLKL